MNYKTWILFAIILLLLPNVASAHSNLMSTNPEAGTIQETAPQQIVMTFNTPIEKLSKFKLFNEARDEIDIAQTEVLGDIMIGTLVSPLDNGKYTVEWIIIGEDGHTVKGNYSFGVKAAERLSAPASSPPSLTPDPTPATVSAEPTASPIQASNGADRENTSDQIDAEDKTDNNRILPIVIVGGLIAAAVFISSLIKRRKL